MPSKYLIRLYVLSGLVLLGSHVIRDIILMLWHKLFIVALDSCSFSSLKGVSQILKVVQGTYSCISVTRKIYCTVLNQEKFVRNLSSLVSWFNYIYKLVETFEVFKNIPTQLMLNLKAPRKI